MKRKYITLLPAVLFVACSSPPNIRQPTTNSLHTVNLDTIPQVQLSMLSSIFKKVKTIILETTDKSVIEGISNMQVFENYIFIIDSHAPHELFVFDTAGQFVRMIG
jgi:hypothetical protein